MHYRYLRVAHKCCARCVFAARTFHKMDTSGDDILKLLVQVYNGWMQYNETADTGKLLRKLVATYEEIKNIAEDPAWKKNNNGYDFTHTNHLIQSTTVAKDIDFNVEVYRRRYRFNVEVLLESYVCFVGNI